MKHLTTILLTAGAFGTILIPRLVLGATLDNPIGGNSETLENVILTVTKALIGLVAFGATFMFIYGGVMMLTSGGNMELVRKSKEVFKWSTISIILIFLTAAMLQFVFTTIGSNVNVPGEEAGLGTTSLQAAVTNILRIVLGLLALVGVVMVVLGGYWWLTAAGNEERITKAKEILRAAITGLIVVILAWAIVSYVLVSSSSATGAK